MCVVLIVMQISFYCVHACVQVTIKLVHINQHFICTLCAGYLFDAQAIKECLHTCTHPTSRSCLMKPLRMHLL